MTMRTLAILAAICGMAVNATATTVTGLVYQITGSALSNSIVTFTPTNRVLVGGSGLVAGPSITRKATNGAFSVPLLRGNYGVAITANSFAEQARGSFSITVTNDSDSDIANITNLITSGALFQTATNPIYTVVNGLVAGTNITFQTNGYRLTINATGSGGGSGNATSFPYLDITNNTPGWREGRLAYDTNTHTFVAYNDRSNVTYNVGEELFVRCLNSSGSTISNGQLVTFSSTGGGTVPRITLAQASLVSAASDFPCLGMATENISNGDSGMITVHGIVRDVYTDNWDVNTPLWLSETTAGAYQTNKPSSDRKSTRLNSSHVSESRMPSSA